MILEEDYIQAIRESLPELPHEKRHRFIEQFGLSPYDADLLSSSRETAEYFETLVTTCGDARLSANWVNGEIAGLLNRQGIDISQCPASAKQVGQLLKRILDHTISGKIAKSVFESICNGEGDADQIIEAKGLKQVTDSGAIEALVDDVIAGNPDQVTQYRNSPPDKQGKLIGFFVGQVMKVSKGKANPKQVSDLLKTKL